MKTVMVVLGSLIVDSLSIDNSEGREIGAEITFADKPMTEFTVDWNQYRMVHVLESHTLTRLNQYGQIRQFV